MDDPGEAARSCFTTPPPSRRTTPWTSGVQSTRRALRVTSQSSTPQPPRASRTSTPVANSNQQPRSRTTRTSTPVANSNQQPRSRTTRTSTPGANSNQLPRSSALQTSTPRANPVSSSTAQQMTAAQRDQNMRLFKMPKQRVKAYWQFIVCVADEAYLDIPTNELTIEHARCAWCLRCNCAIRIAKGKSFAGPHMSTYHVEELHAYEENERQRKAQKTGHHLTNIYGTRWSDTGFMNAASSSDQDKVVDLLAEWVSTSLRPMSIVEDQGLINLVEYANSLSAKLSLPSRQTVSNRIKRSASEYRYSLMKRLEAKCKFFSASADIWSAMNGDSYISLTLHFCNDEFEFESWTLEVIWIPGLHDGPSIACSLASSFSRWHLDPRYCVRFVRDGASNMKRACKILKLKHMSCAAHSLHLVVAAALMQKSSDLLADLPQTADPENHDEDAGDAGALSVENIFQNVELASEPSWIDARMNTIEEGDGISISDNNEVDTEDDESQNEEYVTEAEIAALCSEVVAFVESTASEEVILADMESVRQTVRQFRKLAEYFHRSPKGTHRLKALQPDRQEPLTVKSDCPTRWNSTMEMLLRFGELQPTVVKFFQYLQCRQGALEFSDVSTKNLKLPTAEQWFTAQCLVELLAPFDVATTFLDGESYPTFVALQFSIRTLKTMLSNDKIFDVVSTNVRGESFYGQVLATMHSVRRSFGKLLEKRFEDVTKDELLWVSLLDPYLTNSNLLNAAEKRLAQDCLLNEMLPIMTEYVSEASEDTENVSPEKYANNSRARAGSSWKHLLYGSHMALQSTPTEDQVRQQCKWELEKYLSLSAAAKVSKNGEKPPSSLDWWKKNHSGFPTIAQLAQKWLGCVATSVPSERAFSTAGNVITKRRSSLKPDTARDIIFMAQNVKLGS